MILKDRRYYLHSLYSCYQRQQNVEKYRRMFDELGGIYVKEEDAEVIFVWTCAFRQDAKDNSLMKLQELRKQYPSKEIVICGCMPAIDADVTKKVAEKIEGKIFPWKYEQDYFDLDLLKRCDAVCGVSPVAENIEQYKKEHPDKAVAFADQFVKLCIAEGCTCDCAYCSEKLAFPKYKSFAIELLKQRCKELIAETKCYKIILVADSPGEYGQDIGTNIIELMENLYGLDERLQIALNNFHPFFFKKYLEYFAEKIKQGKLYHINLPIQSASTKVLEKMRRKYSREDLSTIFKTFRELNFQRFDTHIIVGFDGETKEEFEETVQFLEEFKPRYILASKYMYAGSSQAALRREEIVSEDEKQRRIIYLAEKVQGYGAIVNYEGSELGKDRWRRLNHSAEEK